MITFFESNKDLEYNLNEYKNNYYNESLADLVTNVTAKNRIVEYNGELIQQINPVFNDSGPSGLLGYRTHFFAPQKYFFGIEMDTYLFNAIVIWFMSIVLYLTLYYELLAKFVEYIGNIKFGKKK